MRNPGGRFLWIAGCAAVAVARAAGGAPPVRTVELFVKGGGGSYEIGVHPDMVTMLYLPEPVTKVFASDQRRFELHPVAASVAVRPRPGEIGGRATASIDTASLHLAIVLKLVSFEDARAQVFFRRSDQPILDAECQERIGGLGREVEAAKAALAGQVEARARDLVARSIAQALAVTRPHGSTIARNAAGIVLWADSVVRAGDETWLRIGIQNRSRVPFAIGAVEVRPAESGATAGPPPPAASAEAGWERSEVGFDERSFGAVRIPRAGDGKVPRAVSLIVHEARLHRDAALAGVRIDVE